MFLFLHSSNLHIHRTFERHIWVNWTIFPNSWWSRYKFVEKRSLSINVCKDKETVWYWKGFSADFTINYFIWNWKCSLCPFTRPGAAGSVMAGEQRGLNLWINFGKFWGNFAMQNCRHNTVLPYHFRILKILLLWNSL